MNNPLITFVATAHNEPEYDRAFVTSMLAQTCQNFHATVFHNGQNNDFCDYIRDLKVSNIEYNESEIDTGNWGTANRQTAIDECTTEYIIQTSVQDYWLPQAVEYILKGLESKPDMVIFNSINHLISPCNVLNAQLAWSKIDWGNFAIRTDIAKQIPIRQSEYCADWLFINDAIQKGLIKTAKKLDNILTIHN